MRRVYVTTLVLVACLVSMQYVSAAAERVAELQVNQRDENGDTALHRAVRPIWKKSRMLVHYGKPELDVEGAAYPEFALGVIEKLVLAGADVEEKNNAGKTVFEVLKEWGDAHCQYRILSEQARRTIKDAVDKRKPLEGLVQEYLPAPLTRLVLEMLYAPGKAGEDA